MNQASERSTLRRKFALPILLVGALLCMGAKWTEIPIVTLADVAGKWSGNGTTAKGDSYSIDYVFKKDGAYDYGWRATIGGESGKRPPGTLRVNGGKMQWKGSQGGLLWTTTLYETKKGKRKLKGRREDGNRWQLKPKK